MGTAPAPLVGLEPAHHVSAAELQGNLFNCVPRQAVDGLGIEVSHPRGLRAAISCTQTGLGPTSKLWPHLITERGNSGHADTQATPQTCGLPTQSTTNGQLLRLISRRNSCDFKQHRHAAADCSGGDRTPGRHHSQLRPLASHVALQDKPVSRWDPIQSEAPKPTPTNYTHNTN